MESQGITNWLTFCMILVTVWLGFETRKMAVAAKAALELESRPYMSFRGFFHNLGKVLDISGRYTDGVKLGLKLFNPGKVLITYEVKTFSILLNGLPKTIPTFDTTRGVIHPGEELIFFHSLIFLSAPMKIPGDATVDFSIDYWGIPAERKTLNAKVQILFTSLSEHEWHYLEGPFYV